MAADGSLNFDTKIDTKGFEKDAGTLKSRMQSIVSSLNKTGNSLGKSFNNASSSVLRVENSIKTTEQALERLNAEMVELASKQIPTEEYSEVNKQLEETISKYNALQERQDRFIATGGKTNSKAFKSMQYDAEQLKGTLGVVQSELDDLVAKGKAFTLGADTSSYSDMQMKYLGLADKAEVYRQRLAELDTQQKNVTKSGKRMNTSMAKTKQTSIPLTKSIFKLSNMFKLMLLRMAIRATIRAVKEGFENLAQYSNQTNKDLSVLKTSMQTLKNSFATAFAPILTVITPILKTLIGYLSQAISVVGQFFAVFLTGASTFTRAKDAQVDYAKSLKNTAKQANKTLSPIDKLNNISGDSDAGSDGTPAISSMFEEVSVDKKVVDYAGKLKNLFEPITLAFERLKVVTEPFTDIVGSGLKWFLDNVLVPFSKWTISELVPTFLDLLGASITVLTEIIKVFEPYAKWLWEEFLEPIAKWSGEMIIKGLEILTEKLYDLADWIRNNPDTFANGALLILGFFAAFQVTKLLTSIPALIKTFTTLATSGGILNTVLGGLTTAFDILMSPIGAIAIIVGLLAYSFVDLYQNSESFRQSITDLGDTWLEALAPLAEFIKTVLVDVWERILKPVVEFFVNTLIPNLIDIFKDLWQKVLIPLGKFIGSVLQPVFKILSEILTSLWKNVVLPLAEAVGEVLKEAWNAIYDILKTTIIPVVEKVIKVLQFLWDNVMNPIVKMLWDKLKPAFDTVFKGIGKVIDGLKTTFLGIIDFIAGVFTGDWKRAWEGIQNIFKGIFDALVGIVKTPINLIIEIINGMVDGIVTGVNTAIKAINSISFTMPDWVPGFGGKSIGFNIKALTAPKIPKLATGTVVPANYGEFMAILGDNKREPEVVSPVSKIEEAVENVLNRQGSLKNGNINLTINLDGKQIFNSVVTVEKENYGRTGKSVFVH